jgi:hypothetical protein
MQPSFVTVDRRWPGFSRVSRRAEEGGSVLGELQSMVVLTATREEELFNDRSRSRLGIFLGSARTGMG